jgi:hypothetical protein
VQRMASIHITGAMRTTASDILDAHANLLPIDRGPASHYVTHFSPTPSTHQAGCQAKAKETPFPPPRTVVRLLPRSIRHRNNQLSPPCSTLEEPSNHQDRP